MPNMPKGPEIKSALIQAAPLFASMAAGYSSGRGPYAYLDQGIATIQQRQKEMRDAEAAKAATAAFRGAIMPGGNAPMGGVYTGSNMAPAPLRANPGVIGGGQAGVSGAFPAADPGVIGARGGNTFAPQTGMTGFKALEAQYGLPEGYLERTAQIESGGNPNAKNPNSSAGGLFQFIDSTAQQYGLTDKFNPEQAAMAAARLAADNKAILTRTLGREPTAAELYLAHQQGAGGAARLLANPNARAVDVVGADAVRLNGGNENMTAGEFASKWTGKFGGQSAPTDPMQDPEVMRLMEVFAAPGLTPEQRQIVQMRLEARMAQLQPKAPEIREVGNRLVAVNGTDVQEIYAPPAGPADNQAERDIALLGELGIPRDEAIRITQLHTISRDPVTGEAVLIDKRTGQPVNQAAPAQQPAPPPTDAAPPVDEFGPQFPNAPEAFGLGGAARGAVNTAADVVGAQPPFPEAQRAMADFAVLKEKLINDIASGYDRQPPSWLLQNIEALTPRAGSIFTGPDQALAQLDAIGRDLAAELRTTEGQLNDRLSPADREALRKKRVALTAGIGRVRSARSALMSSGDGAIRPEVADRLKAYE